MSLQHHPVRKGQLQQSVWCMDNMPRNWQLSAYLAYIGQGGAHYDRSKLPADISVADSSLYSRFIARPNVPAPVIPSSSECIEADILTVPPAFSEAPFQMKNHFPGSKNSSRGVSLAQVF